MDPAVSRVNNIIVALDFDSGSRALSFVRLLNPHWCRVKVGLELFTAAGFSLIDKLHEQGFDVFLDLKLHDIPNTVAQTVRVCARLGVWMVTVHTLGGMAMLSAAREALESCSAVRTPMGLLGVTLLTSLHEEDLAEIGLAGDLKSVVLKLAHLARRAGLTGVVCSAWEVSLLREQLGQQLKWVTPGIRLTAGIMQDDQRRVMTPEQAVQAGSDFLVIGRPLTQAADPAAVLADLYQRLLLLG